jgi:uncharacterized membrane protein SpoIIM required for sporulation
VNSETFVVSRRPRWLELEAGLTRADRGQLRSLTAAEIERMALLYRHAVSDLSLARREFPGAAITEYLNGLCGRAHVVLHRGRAPRLGQVRRFFISGVPRAFRANRAYFAVSLGVMVAGVLAGWFAYALRPDLRAALVPHSLFDELAKGNSVDVSSPALVSSGIFTSNMRVALIMFIFGVCLGIPTVLLLFFNGWMLGTLGASVHAGGYDFAFWTLIIPHGILELSIIIAAGGAGLRLGDAILRPGQRTRSRALQEAAEGILGMVAGIVILLILAGITEGFISPSALPAWFKITWGVTLGMLFYSWLIFGGRERKRAAPAPSLDRSGPSSPPPLRILPTTGD